MEPPILVTGFEPFDGSLENPSKIVALALDGHNIGSQTIIGAVLPAVRSKDADLSFDLIRKYNPKIVIGLGQGLPNKPILIETVAKNYDNYSTPDNDGVQPKDKLIIQNGSTRLSGTLPVRQIEQELNENGYFTQLSINSGTYICNSYYYQLLDFIIREKLNIMAGFFHIPPVSETETVDNKLAFSIDELTEAALRICTVASNSVSVNSGHLL